MKATSDTVKRNSVLIDNKTGDILKVIEGPHHEMYWNQTCTWTVMTENMKTGTRKLITLDQPENDYDIYTAAT